MGVVDEAGWHAMEAAGKSKNEGIENVPTAVPGPPQAGGVMVTPENDKRSLQRNAGTVAKRVTEKASAGENAPIRTNPDPARPARMADKARTTRRDREDPRTVTGQPW